MKKYYILALALSSLFFGCTKAKKAFDFIALGEEKATLSLVEGKYVIGQTLQTGIGKKDSLLATGLELYFDETGVLKIGKLTSDKYKTRKGPGIGDKHADIRYAYGNPMLENINLRKGSRAIGQMELLLYKHALFLFQADSCTAIFLLQDHIDLPNIAQMMKE